MIKEIAIPVAAFVVTATGVSAFNSDMLEKIDVNLTDSQVSALEEVHEMRVAGAERDEIHEVLEEVGLDQEAMQEIREAMHEVRDENRAVVYEALENEDYEAYQEAIEDTPQSELIDSEADFEKLVEAHELREAGDREGAREIMEDLGFEKQGGHGNNGGMRGQGQFGEGEGRGLGGSRGGNSGN